MRSKATTPATFWPKVDKTGDCWRYPSKPGPGGYCKVSVSGNTRMAHQLAYEYAVGPVPPGMFVLHHCDNRTCVNPAHLFLGTHLDNMADMVAKGRQARGDSHGTRIHPDRVLRGEAHPVRLHPELVKRGERSPNARLTEQEVRAIRDRHAAGVAIRQLARETGMGATTITRIVRRESWRHVA